MEYNYNKIYDDAFNDEFEKISNIEPLIPRSIVKEIAKLKSNVARAKAGSLVKHTQRTHLEKIAISKKIVWQAALNRMKSSPGAKEPTLKISMGIANMIGKIKKRPSFTSLVRKGSGTVKGSSGTEERGLVRMSQTFYPKASSSRALLVKPKTLKANRLTTFATT